MTRSHLRRAVLGVMLVYMSIIALGIWLRRPLASEASSKYALYKDLMPLFIAIPAAYLAFAFQKRSSYLQALRAVWTKMAQAIAAATTYTYSADPSEQLYLQTLSQLTAVIEEVRGVFKNVRSSGSRKGLYPFEPLKQIYLEIRELGFGREATSERRSTVRDLIHTMWGMSRSQLLIEFDRDIPTHHQTQHFTRSVRPAPTPPAQ